MTFHVGEHVRVAARSHDGHHRTPGYVKGKAGTIVRVHASFTNPETRAYGAHGLPKRQLYLVGFPQKELWPEYRGGDDRVFVDLYEHWLEAAE